MQVIDKFHAQPSDFAWHALPCYIIIKTPKHQNNCVLISWSRSVSWLAGIKKASEYTATRKVGSLHPHSTSKFPLPWYYQNHRSILCSCLGSSISTLQQFITSREWRHVPVSTLNASKSGDVIITLPSNVQRRCIDTVYFGIDRLPDHW